MQVASRLNHRRTARLHRPQKTQHQLCWLTRFLFLISCIVHKHRLFFLSSALCFNGWRVTKRKTSRFKRWTEIRRSSGIYDEGCEPNVGFLHKLTARRSTQLHQGNKFPNHQAESFSTRNPSLTSVNICYHGGGELFSKMVTYRKKNVYK